MSITLRWTEEQLAAFQKRQSIPAPQQSPKPIPKQAKYRNAKTEIDGIEFDSRKEAKRYTELRALLRAGEIQALSRQVAFWLPGGIEYRADFTYLAPALVIEDVKSPATRKLPAYRMKVKLMASIGCTITEV